MLLHRPSKTLESNSLSLDVFWKAMENAGSDFRTLFSVLRRLSFLLVCKAQTFGSQLWTALLLRFLSVVLCYFLRMTISLFVLRCCFLMRGRESKNTHVITTCTPIVIFTEYNIWSFNFARSSYSSIFEWLEIRSHRAEITACCV